MDTTTPQDAHDAASTPPSSMDRRAWLKAGALPAFAALGAGAWSAPARASEAGAASRSRVRPGDSDWPSPADWFRLDRAVEGRLVPLHSPFTGRGAASDAERDEALAGLRNPFFIGDQPALTQTSGWVDAWTSRPSAFAVAAKGVGDVVAAVNFAREHRLRLVVKGGGHSYQGTSDAPDSLLVWTRHMKQVELHEAFVPAGGHGRIAAQPAVTLGAGAMWIDAYDAVTTRGGRYVQGGGCTTVGVAGLVQSGGFGSFSKQYGTAAAGLLEAEVVTADGQVRTCNAIRHPDLFWALKGGGGGSLGVVTRVTLRTRELPETFGGVFGAIRASTDDDWRALVDEVLRFYRHALFNPHWGEQVSFHGDRRIEISMVFQGLDAEAARRVWEPLVAWVRARPGCAFERELKVMEVPARHFWDAAYFRQHAPGLMVGDDRPGADSAHAAWAGDLEQAAWFIHGYRSAWMPAGLLEDDRRASLVDAILACTRHWSVGFHFNKGLAGAPAAALADALDTAMNPRVLDAFALAIVAGGGAPAFPGMPGVPRDPGPARRDAAAIVRAMDELRRVAPGAGSYVSESDYFEADWQDAFWGTNHARLAAVKREVDPDGLFFVRHGVGSEAWSEDGFTWRCEGTR
jgi:FAD/FMN-containing dehydrogenase